jgi:hypothetical protein
MGERERTNEEKSEGRLVVHKKENGCKDGDSCGDGGEGKPTWAGDT